MNPFEQTISDYLFGPCSASMLTQLAGESDYWASVDDFVTKNKMKTMAEMSAKQVQWLIRIRDDLMEEAAK